MATTWYDAPCSLARNARFIVLMMEAVCSCETSEKFLPPDYTAQHSPLQFRGLVNGDWCRRLAGDDVLKCVTSSVVGHSVVNKKGNRWHCVARYCENRAPPCGWRNTALRDVHSPLFNDCPVCCYAVLLAENWPVRSPDHAGRTHHWNFGHFVPDYTMQYPRIRAVWELVARSRLYRLFGVRLWKINWFMAAAIQGRA